MAFNAGTAKSGVPIKITFILLKFSDLRLKYTSHVTGCKF
jgi:hypothetical protein